MGMYQKVTLFYILKNSAKLIFQDKKKHDLTSLLKKSFDFKKLKN